MKLLKLWRILLIALFLILGLFILVKYFALDGTLNISYDFSNKPTLISEITPAGRASDRQQNLTTKETYQTLSGDPVYFSAEVPRSYDNVEVTLKYNNPSQNIIELGLNKSTDWNFELKPIENKFIDNSSWDKLEKDPANGVGEIILLQKNKSFDSVDEFLNNPPLDQRILTYNYQLPYTYKLDNYQSNSSELIIDKKLRGKHEFYTYIKDEDLDFTFIYQDLNALTDRDDFKVEVYSGSSQIHSDFIEDDGIESANGEVSSEKTKQILLTDLPEGLYKISLPVTNDIVVNQIKTKQHLLVVKNSLNLYQSPDPLTLYTEIDNFLFKTDNPESLQTVFIKENSVEINSASQWFEYQDNDDILDDLKEINLAQGDLYLQGSGYYAFTAQSYFDPDYSIDYLENYINIEDYDYLIAANYNPPVQETRYQEETQTFSLDQVPGDRKTLNFLISLPGLDEINDDILIKEINLKFTRSNLWQKLKSLF